MRTKLSFLIGLPLALACGWAVAQQNVSNRTNNGTEAIVAAQGGPGGPSIFLTTGQLRNGMNMQTTASTSGTLSVLTPAISGLISTAACGGAMVVNLPTSPWDGQTVEWVNGTAATAFTTGCTVATTDGSTITGGAGANAVGTLAAGASAEWRYVLSTNTWYRLR